MTGQAISEGEIFEFIGRLVMENRALKMQIDRLMRELQRIKERQDQKFETAELAGKPETAYNSGN